MATYDASVKRALSPEQEDLIDHKEHCSADPEKLATVGRACKHQVRIKQNDQEYGLANRNFKRPFSSRGRVLLGS